jgi:glutathione S-transferase
MAMTALNKAGLTYEVVVCQKKDLHSKEFKAMNPLATVPVLETEQGPVCGTATILRWVGRNNADLYGSTPEQ